MAPNTNGKAPMLPLWIKLSTKIVDHDLWSDPLAIRLWIYLLSLAKRGSNDGTVRFSYTHAQKALAERGPKNKRVVPTRKRLRAALRAWDRAGTVHVPSGEQARAQGGEQGYIVVTIADWRTWYPPRVDRGTGQGTGQGRSREQGREQDREHQEESLRALRARETPPYPPKRGAEMEGAHPLESSWPETSAVLRSGYGVSTPDLIGRCLASLPRIASDGDAGRWLRNHMGVFTTGKVAVAAMCAEYRKSPPAMQSADDWNARETARRAREEAESKMRRSRARLNGGAS